jgi:three-Cys-motif partner protein
MGSRRKSELPPPEDDHLYIPPPVGGWSRDKHHFLQRYVNAFTTSMRKKWPELHYIDLFAGAGLERYKDTGKLGWGSPLIAAQAPYSFAQLHLCEKNQRKYEALAERVRRFFSSAQVILGDANDEVNTVLATIPRRTLSLAFLDPYGLHLNFETLRTLSTRQVDLIILFPDRVDMLRNWEKVYEKDLDSNLDRVLGPAADWRGLRRETAARTWADGMRRLYVSQIESLGYSEFEYERIEARGRPLYVLIFCSKDKAGARIWRGISSTKPNKQRMLDFDA